MLGTSLCVQRIVGWGMPVTESRAATEKLHAELLGLGVTSAYEVGDDATLSVWIGLVVR